MYLMRDNLFIVDGTPEIRIPVPYTTTVAILTQTQIDHALQSVYSLPLWAQHMLELARKTDNPVKELELLMEFLSERTVFAVERHDQIRKKRFPIEIRIQFTQKSVPESILHPERAIYVPHYV